MRIVIVEIDGKTKEFILIDRNRYNGLIWLKSVFLLQICFSSVWCFVSNCILCFSMSCRVRDRMVVSFAPTYAISWVVLALRT